MSTYQREDVKVPTVGGVAFRALVTAIEGPLGSVLLGKMLRDSGIEYFRSDSAGHAPPTQPPLPHPPAPPTSELEPGIELARRATSAPQPSTRLETISAFARAYRERATDPVAVIHRAHQAITGFDSPERRLNLFIARKPDEVLRDAEASKTRLDQGRPLSVLDGVPVAVKDEVDLAGFATTLGTRFLTQVRDRDSVVAARLRAAGAVILGKTNMNEIGINPLGLNPHHGAVRNPFDLSRQTGGSSSGSAATVAAGLCPVAIGADGGGSIRIPAALCGVVGLKPTFGRVPETGVPVLCASVGHLGPIGLTVDDVAATYGIIAGPDAHDANSLNQPPAHLHGYADGSLRGLRVGVCDEYFDDAHPEVVGRCRNALKNLVERGAIVVPVPPPNLNTILWAHSTIILSEMAESMLAHGTDFSRFSLATRLNLAIGLSLTSTDLTHALRVRHRLALEQLELMQRVDLIATPTTAMTAPPIPEKALPEGESNLLVVDALMRFIRLTNLTGFPSLSVPVGYDSHGLPVGLQLTARPWAEDVLLRVGRVLEGTVERRTPAAHAALLS